MRLLKLHYLIASFQLSWGDVIQSVIHIAHTSGVTVSYCKSFIFLFLSPPLYLLSPLKSPFSPPVLTEYINVLSVSGSSVLFIQRAGADSGVSPHKIHETCLSGQFQCTNELVLTNVAAENNLYDMQAHNMAERNFCEVESDAKTRKKIIIKRCCLAA